MKNNKIKTKKDIRGKKMGLRLLKSKRVLKGFTQEKLATKIGINTKTYNLK